MSVTFNLITPFILFVHVASCQFAKLIESWTNRCALPSPFQLTLLLVVGVVPQIEQCGFLRRQYLLDYSRLILHFELVEAGVTHRVSQFCCSLTLPYGKIYFHLIGKIPLTFLAQHDLSVRLLFESLPSVRQILSDLLNRCNQLSHTAHRYVRFVLWCVPTALLIA